MSNIVQIKAQGFTRMDNDLMEGLAKVDLPARDLRVLMAIARQTIGYQVESKRLSADELGKQTNMRRDVVSKVISHLLERRIIFRVGGSRGEIGVSPVSEWTFFEEKQASLTETKTSHWDNIVSLGKPASETKTAVCLLYTKKEPLLTLPTVKINAPQGADTAPIENPELKPAAQIEAAQQVLFNGEDFTVHTDLINKWAKAYAPIDVEAEIVRAAAWASAAKPKKDWRRYLVNWLARAYRKAPKVADEAGVPVDKIIDLYHRTCPNLTPVSVAADNTLRTLIVERWNESTDHQSGQGFWLPFFRKANNRNQVFYRGNNIAPRLEALVSRAVFREIVESAQ